MVAAGSGAVFTPIPAVLLHPGPGSPERDECGYPVRSTERRREVPPAVETSRRPLVLVDEMPDPRELVGARVRDRDGHDLGRVQTVHADDRGRLAHVSVADGGRTARFALAGAEYDDAVLTVDDPGPADDPGGA